MLLANYFACTEGLPSEATTEADRAPRRVTFIVISTSVDFPPGQQFFQVALFVVSSSDLFYLVRPDVDTVHGEEAAK